MLGAPLVRFAGDRARLGLRCPHLFSLEFHCELDVVDVLTFALEPVRSQVFLVNALADYGSTATR
jgi:hypothetical protein